MRHKSFGVTSHNAIAAKIIEKWSIVAFGSTGLTFCCDSFSPPQSQAACTIVGQVPKNNDSDYRDEF